MIKEVDIHILVEAIRIGRAVGATRGMEVVEEVEEVTQIVEDTQTTEVVLDEVGMAGDVEDRVAAEAEAIIIINQVM